MRRPLRILLAAPLILLLAFASLVSWFGIVGGDSLRAQTARMIELRSDDVRPAPSGDTHAFDDTPFERLQVVASHNSYAERPTWLQTEIIRLIEPAEAPALQYDHDTLTAQLDAGIRSFELDVRWNGRSFTMEHVPLVANRGTAIDFALALEEIALWSTRHTDHLPISIMVEVKGDYMFLDPRLKPFDAEAADALDELVRVGLGERHYSPADLAGAEWPTVGELRDRVLLYFGENEGVRELYLDGHAGLEGRAIFTSSKTGAPDARFAVVDDPRDERLAPLLEQGVIVRTRADANLLVDAATRDAAFASGAQIVSTDFPPSQPHESGYAVAFLRDALARPAPDSRAAVVTQPEATR